MSDRRIENEFLKDYEARVRPSTERMRRFKRDYERYGFKPVDWATDSFSVEDVPQVEIVMPEDRYRAMLRKEKILRDMFDTYSAEYSHPIDKLWDEYKLEQRVQEEVPAVKAAYEKYQSLLALSRSQFDV